MASFLGRVCGLTLCQLDGTCADAWKRRGQVRAARGADAEALTDLSTAVALEKVADEEVLHQRGLVRPAPPPSPSSC